MLGLEEVEPLPVPSSPAMMQEMPSVKMPLSGNENRLGPASTLLRHPCLVARGGTGRVPRVWAAGCTC